jgi:Protein of unknown function (DUF3147)
MATLHLGAIRETTAGEYLLRFAFGGTMTAMTGLIAHAWGPAVGGLFLAFPAILPASLTLVARHDGRRQAAHEARGAVLGAIGLAAFAVVSSLSAMHAPPVVTLALAATVWGAVSGLLWWVVYGGRGG